MVDIVSSDTMSAVDSVSAIPNPHPWSDNTGAVMAADLNREFRDPLRFLMGDLKPVFIGRNTAVTALNPSGTAIPWNAEDEKLGGMTHSTNSTKVFVPESGWYKGVIWFCAASTTGDTGFHFRIRVKVNNTYFVTAHDGEALGSGNPDNFERGHIPFSLRLKGGDYIEVVASGTWTNGELNTKVPALGEQSKLDIWYDSKT